MNWKIAGRVEFLLKNEQLLGVSCFGSGRAEQEAGIGGVLKAFGVKSPRRWADARIRRVPRRFQCFTHMELGVRVTYLGYLPNDVLLCGESLHREMMAEEFYGIDGGCRQYAGMHDSMRALTGAWGTHSFLLRAVLSDDVRKLWELYRHFKQKNILIAATSPSLSSPHGEDMRNLVILVRRRFLPREELGWWERALA